MNIIKTMDLIYLEYLNSFLTIERFAEHYGLTKDEALKLVTLAKEVRERDINK
jgi:hypothetical protein